MEDRNNLNEFSVKIAKYFYSIKQLLYKVVNSYEVCHLGKTYMSLKKSKRDNYIYATAIIRDLYINPAPLFNHIFSYFDNIMDWNHFFQFIVYFSMSPMIAIFYTLIRTLPDASRKISWNQIYNFSSLLETDNYISNATYDKFIALDLNNDGKLSFSQFFKFVTQTYELWEPLYLFKVALIMKYFPNNMHLTILERRKNINSIKEYQLRNMNKLPSQSCNQILIRLLCGIPNPNRYDYDNETAGGAIIYNEIVNLFIKQFDPNYTSHRDGFKSNYLKLFKIFEVIYTIDQYFLLYYQADISKIKARQRGTTDQSKTLVSMYDSYLSESSCNQSTYMGLSGRKTTTKSILRSTSGMIAKSSRRNNVESTNNNNNNNGFVVSINNNVIMSGNDDNAKFHKAVSQLSAISAASALHASLYPHLQPYQQLLLQNNNNNNNIASSLPSPKHYLSTPVTTVKGSGDGCGSLLPGMIPGSTNSVESNHSTLNEDYQNIDSEIQV